MRSGRDVRWTEPAVVVTVMGKPAPPPLPGLAGLAGALLQAAHAAARTVMATMANRVTGGVRMIILRSDGGRSAFRCDIGSGAGTSRPSSEDRSSAQARRPGSSSAGGITVAGQRRDHTGFAGHCTTWNWRAQAAKPIAARNPACGKTARARVARAARML